MTLRSLLHDALRLAVFLPILLLAACAEPETIYFPAPPVEPAEAPDPAWIAPPTITPDEWSI